MDNARRVIIVSSCMFTKKIKFLLVNIFFKKANVRKVISVFIDI
jgi:hypothetical protein